MVLKRTLIKGKVKEMDRLIVILGKAHYMTRVIIFLFIFYGNGFRINAYMVVTCCGLNEIGH